jgi:sorbitol/mannitol transport system substrate-binding protein
MATRRRHVLRGVLAAAAAGTLLASCAGAGGGGASEHSINVLMVNNPPMKTLQKLTAKHFTKETGIKVHFTVLPENQVRDKISQDFASQSGQYDVATISNYETPIYAERGWLYPLDPYVKKDEKYDQQDVLKPMRIALSGKDGKAYAEPFYGESSFLMYRKDVFADLGLTMPEKPTWDEVADLAAKIDAAKKDMKGICLRGLPGWGELIAPLTTVVNTFGGTWFDENWHAQLDSPEFTEATKFYVNLVRKHGEAGAAQAGFAECLNSMTQGKTAMWYDATAGAGELERKDSPVAGKIGYAPAPVKKTDNSGWLFTWAFGMQKASDNPDDAWKFISWATGKEYEQLAGTTNGWASIPAGKRASTYDNPHYTKTAGAFSDKVREAIKSANPSDPGVQKRPYKGIQFVGIPEFTSLGTDVSQEISAAIAGRQSVEQALAKSQKLAEKVGKEYRDR